MKVLLVSSSPHKEKSSTFQLAGEVLRGLKDEGVSCETVHLAACNVSFCNHCDACHQKMMRCPLKDDVGGILQKMLDADGIVLASPNYINQVTGSMKALMDRSSHFIHCKRLLGKFVAGVVTSGSGRDKEVLDYIRFYGHICGAQSSGGISAMQRFGQENKGEAYKLGKKLAADIKEKKSYPDQAEIIDQHIKYFARVMSFHKDAWKEEYGYWVGKGWL